MNTVDLKTIFKALPHRYPFLLIDRVLDWEQDTWLTGLKNVTYNEPFFQGHFPDHPVMPGVLILEAMAQASGVHAYVSRDSSENNRNLYYLVKIDKARFMQIVGPGDQLVLHVERKRLLRGMGLYDTVARVDDKVVCSAEIMCAERAPD